jgi:DNA-binding protein Fis
MQNQNYLKSVQGNSSQKVGQAHAREDIFQGSNDKFIQLVAELKANLEAFELAFQYDSPSVESGVDFYAQVRDFEISLITKAMRCTRGSQVKAAKLLRLNNTTLNHKIKTYDIVY